jgi:F-type H+/Na+-transporting ATPase subunit beta
MLVETDGNQLTVPVGKKIMGRMFDVFGNTIDQEKPLSTEY